MRDHDDVPELSYSLDVRALQCWLETEDDQPVMHICDGAQHVALESVAGGSAADAAAGVRALIETARTFIATVEGAEDAEEPAWWTAPEVVAPEQLRVMPEL